MALINRFEKGLEIIFKKKMKIKGYSDTMGNFRCSYEFRSTNKNVYCQRGDSIFGREKFNTMEKLD